MTYDRASANRLGIAQAARVAGVSRQAIYNWIGAGWLRTATADGGGVDGDDLARLCAMREAAADLGVRPATLRRIRQGEGTLPAGSNGVAPNAVTLNGVASRRRVVASGAKLAYATPLVVAAMALGADDAESGAVSGGGEE